MEVNMKSTLLTISFVLLLIAQGGAQIPRKISYQGILTDALGAPAVDGNYSLQFQLFDQPTGGSAMYTESDPSVPVHRGSFKYVIGSAASLSLPFDRPYFLELSVIAGPGIVTPLTFPRTEFSSVPYSLRADTAEYARAVAGGTTLRLPFLDTTVVSPAETGVFEIIDHGLGYGGFFANLNPANETSALSALTKGTGPAFGADNDNEAAGSAGSFVIQRPTNSSPALIGMTHGNGAGVEGLTLGSGSGVKGTSDFGYGVAGYTRIGFGVFGSNNNSNRSEDGYAGYFSGRTYVSQDLIGWGNIGLGTTAPATRLHIHGDNEVVRIQGVSPSIQLRNTSGSNVGYVQNKNTNDVELGTNSANTTGLLTLATQAVPRVTVRESGNVGIGTTSPASRLDVAGGQWDLASTEGDVRIGDGNYRLKLGIATGGGGAGDARIRAQGGLNRLSLGVNTSDLLTLYGAKVGIGNSSPATTLHVSDASSPASFTLGVNSTAGGYTALLTSLSSVSGGYAGIQAIQSAGSAYGKLALNKDGGNVGVGKEPGDYKLDVNGTINATNVYRNGSPIPNLYEKTTNKSVFYPSYHILPNRDSTSLSGLGESFTLADSAIVIVTASITHTTVSSGAREIGRLVMEMNGAIRGWREFEVGYQSSDACVFYVKLGPGSHTLSFELFNMYVVGNQFAIHYAEYILQIIPKG